MKGKTKENKSVAEIYKVEFDMISFSDADNKTKLEEKKLKAEILALKEELTSVYEKKLPKKKSFLKWLEDNTNRILIVSGFVGAGFGLVKPAYDYITNAEKHEKAKFNGEMLNLVKGLTDESAIKRERNLNLLTYYNPELVIPFFLNDLDCAPIDSIRQKINEPAVEKISKAIKISWDNIPDKGRFSFFSPKKEAAEEIYCVINRIFSTITADLKDNPVNEQKLQIFLDIMKELNLWRYDSDFIKMSETLSTNITNSNLSDSTKTYYTGQINLTK